MKALALLSASVALVALALVSTPAVAGSALFAGSVLVIFVADYRRSIKPLTARAAVIAFTQPVQRISLGERAA